MDLPALVAVAAHVSVDSIYVMRVDSYFDCPDIPVFQLLVSSLLDLLSIFWEAERVPVLISHLQFYQTNPDSSSE